MNRIRMLVLMGAALGLAGVVTLLTYKLFRERLKPAEDMVRVVVVNQKVALGTKLTAADIRMTAWPKSVALPGLFHDPAEVVGRGVILPMEMNEPVLESKLAGRNAGAGLMTTIPEGMRAVSIRVNDVIGVAGFVVPGSRVDVILTGSISGLMDSAITILENVEVLAAGQAVNRDSEGKPLNVPVITLLVSPEDSEKLALVTADGRIQLALRNPLDREASKPRPVQRADLYSGAWKGPGQQQNLGSWRAPLPPAPVKAAAAAKTPAPTPVAPAEPPAPPQLVIAPTACPPQFVEVQLIQGTASQTFKFPQKPVSENQPCA